MVFVVTIYTKNSTSRPFQKRGGSEQSTSTTLAFIKVYSNLRVDRWYFKRTAIPLHLWGVEKKIETFQLAKNPNNGLSSC